MMAGRLLELERNLMNIVDSQVIIIHDAKDDQTGNELRSLLEEIGNPKIKMIEGRFGSPGAARNAGLRVVDTEWISFWDSDDLADATKYQQAIEEAGLATDIIVGQYSLNYISQTRSSLGLRKTSSVLDLATELGIWRMIFRRKILMDCTFPDLLMGEDQLFFLDVLRKNPEITFTDKIIYSYSIGSSLQLTENPHALKHLSQLVAKLQEQPPSANQNFQSFLFMAEIRQFSSAMFSNYVENKFFIAKTFIKRIAISNDKKLYILTFLDFLRRTTKSKSVSKFTTVLNGGLGNQLFQLAYSLASTDTKVNLNSQLGNVRKIENSNLPDIMNFWLPIRVQLDWNPGRGMISRKIGNFLLRKNFHSKPSTSIFKKYVFDSINTLSALLLFKHGNKINANRENVLPHSESGSINFGYFQSAEWANSPGVRHELRKLSPRYISKRAQELILIARQLEPVVMHIRLGDYLSESKFGNLSPSYYSSCVRRIRENFPQNEIWIFSDDRHLCSTMIAEIEIQNYKYVDTEEMNPAEILEIMRHGSAYILANSSFSWWAGFLRKDHDALVIAPKTWFQKLRVSPSLIPLEWNTQESEWT